MDLNINRWSKLKYKITKASLNRMKKAFEGQQIKTYNFDNFEEELDPENEDRTEIK